MAIQAFTVAEYRDYVEAGEPLPAETAIEIVDSSDSINGLADTEIAALAGNNVTLFNATDNAVSLNLQQLMALGTVGFSAEDKLTLLDAESALQSLSSSDIDYLSGKGVGLIVSDGDTLRINSDAALAILNTQIGFDANDSVVVNSSEKLGLGFSVPEIIALSNRGIDVIDKADSTNNSTSLGAAQAMALASSTIAFASNDSVTITDDGSDISALSAADLAQLNTKGVDAIDAWDDALTLSYEQFKALGATTLAAKDKITLEIGSTDFAALDEAHLAGLASKGIDVLSLKASGQALASLSPEKIAEFVAKGVDVIDAGDNSLALSVSQFEALGAAKLTGSDVVTLADTGARLAALTTAQISALAAAGIDILDATDKAYTLSLAQYAALGSVALSANDVVTINAGADAALSNGGNHLTLTGNAVSGTGNDLANTVKGNDKSNVLSGLGGNDVLFGKAGKDQLWGGAGKDAFVFDTRLNKSTNVDKIYDFKASDDSFWLDNAIFTKLGSGTPTKPVMLKAGMFWTGTKAHDRDDRVIYDKKTGSLYYDDDGSGRHAQVKIATLTNKAALDHKDFFVI